MNVECVKYNLQGNIMGFCGCAVNFHIFNNLIVSEHFFKSDNLELWH